MGVYRGLAPTATIVTALRAFGKGWWVCGSGGRWEGVRDQDDPSPPEGCGVRRDGRRGSDGWREPHSGLCGPLCWRVGGELGR